MGLAKTSGRAAEITPLSIKSLQAGSSLVLGVVERVGLTDVTLALPNNMSGRVSLAQLSDPIYARAATAMDEESQAGVAELARSAVQPGQVVTAAVLAIDAKANGSKRLALSTRASVVNRGLRFEHLLPGGTLYAALSSEEDHGWVVATGLEGVSAFLPKKNIKGRLPEGGLREGMPAYVIVLAVNEAARTVTCGLNADVASYALTRCALTLQGLKPGMLVHGLVDEHLKNGLALSFLQGFQGGIETGHLDQPYRDNEWKQRFKLGRIQQARVLMVDSRAKVIYLTLRPHLLSLRTASSLPDVGTVLDEAVVLRVDAKKGLLLGLPVGEDDQDAREQGEREEKMAKRRKKRAKARGQGGDEDEEEEGDAMDEDGDEDDEEEAAPSVRYVPLHVHKGQMGDDEDAEEGEGKARVFKVGEAVRCRVIGRSSVDGCAFASIRPSTLSAPFLRLADVKPASSVRATVVSVEEWGLTVDLGEHIRAHCTNMHLGDAPAAAGAVAAKRRQKFKPGQVRSSYPWHRVGLVGLLSSERHVMVDADSTVRCLS